MLRTTLRLSLFTLVTAVSACTSSNDPARLVTPSYQTLAAQTAGPTEERFQQCRAAWNHYEFRCRRELVMWHNMNQRGFCKAWAKTQATEAVLPGFTRSTQRCY